MQKIAVIGAGVIGLSTTLKLNQNGYKVELFTKDDPAETNSSYAGAIWDGTFKEGVYREWSEVSLLQYIEDAKSKDSGVTLKELLQIYRTEVPDPWFKNTVPMFQVVSETDTPPGVKEAHYYSVPHIDPKKYLEFLFEKVSKENTIFYRELDSLGELSEDFDVVINCSGLGSRELAKDTTMYPVFGQLLLSDSINIEHSFMDDEEFTYYFSHEGYVVFGGVALKDKEFSEDEDKITAEITQKVQKILPQFNDSKISKIQVGIRPGRKNVRLETEHLENENTKIIHNYGHEGLGYTYAWGCASSVFKKLI